MIIAFNCKKVNSIMTYGDYIRQMSDEQLAVLLDTVLTDGLHFGAYRNISQVWCEDVSEWLRLIQSERPSELPPKFGIM